MHEKDKYKYLKTDEINIHHNLGQAVPTNIFNKKHLKSLW